MHKLGIDIDGVVANTQPVIIDILNRLYGKNYCLEDFFDFNPQKMFGISREDIYQKVLEHELDLIKYSQPMPQAVEQLHRLADHYELYFISARSTHYYQYSVDWFARYKIPYREIIHLGQHHKLETARQKQVGLFIEDTLPNAIHIARGSIPVLLYNATYNQGQLPAGITRVYSWDEIASILLKQDREEVTASAP
ncbi:MAG: 5' nucleotidase, NT5C type [Desulfurispora sp.]|uniref:5' nucleotidase, NT5C type n=1 Tax=Desulfurispora sp. TaxID=3014275 RepID=UPI00404A538D